MKINCFGVNSKYPLNGSLVLPVEDIELFDKGFGINMLLIFLQFEIFLVGHSHIMNFNKRHEIRLHLNEFLIVLFDLVVGQDGYAVVDLVPEGVDGVVQQNCFSQISVEPSQVLDVGQSAGVLCGVVGVEAVLPVQ